MHDQTASPRPTGLPPGWHPEPAGPPPTPRGGRGATPLLAVLGAVAALLIGGVAGVAIGSSRAPAASAPTEGAAALEADLAAVTEERDTLQDALDDLEEQFDDLQEERDDLQDALDVVREATPEIAPLEEGAAPAAGEPVTISGDGQGGSDPFGLRGGQYRLDYSYDGNCFYTADLSNPDTGGPVEFLVSGPGPTADFVNLFGIAEGTYFIDMVTGPSPGCPWTLTFTPTG